ncbi:MAG: hypothetical protein ACFCUJ_05315 [Thiotrichales bacterium]
MNLKLIGLIAVTFLTLTACQPETADTAKAPDAAQATAPAATPTPTASAAPTTPHPGEALHAEKCVECHVATHDASFYQRAERKTTNYAGVQSMVRLCDANLGTQLFDDDMVAIGDYLNDSFYKFPRD